MSRSHPPKIQRWFDLIAALLRRRYRVTFEELVRDVPAYAHALKREALTRMFERDKDELRALGLSLETMTGDDGEPSGYLLRRRDFYLPYIVVERSDATSGLGARPGYRDLPTLVIQPDELAAIAAAAERVRQLGDPELAADAQSALAKLAFDLPAGTLGRQERSRRTKPAALRQAACDR
jgi:predicted DNA-binding transcriptional regulator YafY